MSQFEKSEVMVEYARLMKEAGWRDVIDTLGLDALLGGAGAVGAGIAGKSMLAGALGLTAAGGGLVVAVLGLGLTAYFTYQAAMQTNDNLDDLVEKLDALDPGDATVEAKIEEWKKALEQFSATLKAGGEVAANQEQLAKVNLQKIDTMVKITAYLKQMQYEWQQVKTRLNDWGQDDVQAEQALNKTTTAMEAILNQLKQTAKQDAARIVAETQAQSGTDYKKLSEELLATYDQIKQISGQPPVPDDVTESQALGLARMIREEKPVTKEQLEQYGPFLLKSKQSLEQLLTRIQPKRASDLSMSKRASKVLLSKRAWRLATDPPKGQGQIGGQRRVGDENTKKLQRLINILNVNYRTGVDTIDDDGIYGPLTAAALSGLMNANESVAATFNNYDITNDIVQQPQAMRGNPANIQKAYKILDKISRITSGETEPERSAKEETPRDAMQVDSVLEKLERRRNLSDEEILYYINNKVVTEPGTDRRATIREFINENSRNMPGMVPDKYKDVPGMSSAVKLIKQVYFDGGQTAPIEWITNLGALFRALSGGVYGRIL
jgi:hypothetical protein